MQENSANPWYTTWWGIISIIVGGIVSVFLVAAAIYIYTVVRDIKAGKIQNPNEITLSEQQKFNVSTEGNYWIGTDNPKVTIVEFADYTCPFCEKSYPTIRELGLKYKDSVKIVFKDYPLKQEYSIDLAMGARCAGEQGLFWPMHDKLFQNQGVSKTDEIALLAQQAGADMTRYAECYNKEKYLPAIQRDIIEGQELKLAGTPTWFVNGYKLEGDIPMKTWEAIIEKFLQ